MFTGWGSPVRIRPGHHSFSFCQSVNATIHWIEFDIHARDFILVRKDRNIFPDTDRTYMSFFRLILMIGCFFVVLSMSGPGMSEETPGMITVISGGESTILEIEPGIYQAHIQDIDSNATVFYENRSVQVLLKYAFLANSSSATMDLMDNKGEEKTFLVRATDLRYFEENQSLVCEITPQEFPGSTSLAPNQSGTHEIVPGLYTRTNVSFEYSTVPGNSPLNSCCTFDQVDSKKCVPMRPLCGY